MDKDQYYKEVEAILDRAAGDKSLSTEDYADLCGDVEDSARGRRDGAEADLEAKRENAEEGL